MTKDLDKVKDIVFVCNGGSCLAKGAEENTNVLRAALKSTNIDEDIHTIKTRCCGQCKSGPVVFVFPEGIWYKEIDLALSERIVTEHLLKRDVLTDNILFNRSAINTRSSKWKRAFKKILKIQL